jgi:AraC family transcriptional regulator, transcriptional activator of pobA
MRTITVHKFIAHQDIHIDHIVVKDEDVFIHEPHTHNFHEIGYFENASGTHTIDFTTFPIETNTAYFLKKGIVHTLLRKKGSHGKVISFQESILSESSVLQKLLFVTPHIYLPDEKFIFFKQLFFQLENYLVNETFKKKLVGNYLQLILSFFENYAQSSIETNEKIHSFLAYIETHFSAKLTVDECLANMNLSYQQLYHEVQKKLNKTPIDVIKDRLVLQAKRLLFNTEMSVKEIAFELEFEDASYFSKYFKTHTGLSPMEFKIKLNIENQASTSH